MGRRWLDLMVIVTGLGVAVGCDPAGDAGDDTVPAAALPETTSPKAAAPAVPAPAAAQHPIKPQIPDTVLIDQDGREQHFYTDLIKDKLVIVNALYTSCPATCPIQAGVFAGVQERLGDRVGKDVQLISITLDPATDTPERLKQFAERFNAGPGWVLLTGPKPDVVEVLQAMDLYAADPADHTPIAAIGNEPAGVWMKTINLISPVEMVSKLNYVAGLEQSQLAQ
jgi:protein SCO1/2